MCYIVGAKGGKRPLNLTEDTEMARVPMEATDRPARPQDAKHLWDHHHEVIRLLLLGWKPAEISQQTGLSQSYISALRNSPLAQEQFAVLTAARDANAVHVATMIAEYAPKAAQLLQKVIDGEIQADVRTQVQVCQDWLSRNGNSPIQRGTFETHRSGIDEETCNMIKQNSREAAKRARIEDADYTIMQNKEENTDAQSADCTDVMCLPAATD